MITIHHNFDETKFMWLWAKYVKAGNIEKHCTACMIGPYSKKFSGASNHNLLEQPTMVMDEVPEGQYEAIYFCGVLKKGYLNKNPLKNNYPHNVHFAIRPADGEHDVWDFENWHVEIENGKLERIPATYELGPRFFKEPYTPHFYTCRIFRWMIGHFYPQELRDLKFGLPDTITIDEFYAGKTMVLPTESLVKAFIKHGFECAMNYFEDDFDNIGVWEEMSDEANDVSIKIRRNNVLAKGKFNRKLFFERCQPYDWMIFDEDVIIVDAYGTEQDVNLSVTYEDKQFNCIVANDLYNIGMNEFLDMVAPYQERDIVPLFMKD